MPDAADRWNDFLARQGERQWARQTEHNRRMESLEDSMSRELEELRREHQAKVSGLMHEQAQDLAIRERIHKTDLQELADEYEAAKCEYEERLDPLRSEIAGLQQDLNDRLTAMKQDVERLRQADAAKLASDLASVLAQDARAARMKYVVVLERAIARIEKAAPTKGVWGIQIGETATRERLLTAAQELKAALSEAESSRVAPPLEAELQARIADRLRGAPQS